MKVYLSPMGLHSHAMVRIANALWRHAPQGVEFVYTPLSADLVVMYVIGQDAMQAAKDFRIRGIDYVAMQCCIGGVHEDGVNVVKDTSWEEFWREAALVWSYYDMRNHAKEAGFRFYHSPLGIDPVFTVPLEEEHPRPNTVMTSGYMSGPGCEVIEDAWRALAIVGGTGVHLGPPLPGGMEATPPGWDARLKISDKELAVIYRNTKWVTALRYVEGFEMPAIEALACGARPIVFDRPDMRQWYDGHAVFVPELSGDAMVEALVEVMSKEPEPVTAQERALVLEKFGWEHICRGFWSSVMGYLAGKLPEFAVAR